MDSRPHTDEINLARALSELLPMVAEVNIGLGTFELSIEDSNEVREVLDRCGGQRDLLGSYWDRIAAEAAAEHEAAEAAERERIAGITRAIEEARTKACVWTGQLDEDWHRSMAGEMARLPPEVQAEVRAGLACRPADADALAVDPSCVFPPARYPPAAMRSGISGTAVIEIQIGRSGEVTDAQVHRSSSNRDLDRAALRAVRDAECTPARINGEPVPSAMRAPVEFGL